jgi:hypothetical protein
MKYVGYIASELRWKILLFAFFFGTILQEQYDTLQLTHAVVLISVVVAVWLAIAVPQEWYATA